MANVITRSRKKLSRKKRHIMYAVIAFLFISAILYFIVSNETPSGVVALNSAKLPFASDSVFVPFRDGAVYLDKSKKELHYADGRGNVGWGFTQASPELRLEASDELVAAFSGNKVQLISSTGKILVKKQYEYEIESVRCGTELMAVNIIEPELVSDTNSGSVLHIYDTNGKEVDVIDDLTYDIVDYGFYSENDVLWVIVSNTDAVNTQSRITIYEPKNNKTTGDMRIKGELIYDIIFSDKEIYLIGSDKIYTYNYTSDLQRYTDCKGLVALDWNATSNNIQILMTPLTAAGTFSNVNNILNNAGKTTYNLSIECIAGIFGQKRIYMFGRYLVQSFDYSAKKEIMYALPEESDRIIKANNEYNVLAVCGKNVYSVKLPQ